MRKIIASTYSTLDGYIDNPHLWSLRYSDDESERYTLAMTLAAGALLSGRVTYEGMAQVWPTMSGNPFADHVNSVPKYVVASRPVDTSVWNNSVVIPGETVIDEVTRLKGQEGGDILMWGSGGLTDALAAAALLDEYRIWIYPVIKGGGQPLFRPESTATLELADSETFSTGVVVLTYRPVIAGAGGAATAGTGNPASTGTG